MDFTDALVFVPQDMMSTNPGELFARQHIEHAIPSDSATESDNPASIFINRARAHGVDRNTL